MGWLEGWSNRLEYTIDYERIDEDLDDFPTRVVVSSGVGRNNFDATCVFDELSTSGTEYKIAMTDYTGINQLPVEIEYWDLGTEKAYLWTKVSNVVSGTDTTIYLYYDIDQPDNDVWVGDIGSDVGQEVWDSNYKFVHHMMYDTIFRDSTSNNYNGTPTSLSSSDNTVDDVGPGIVYTTGKFIDYGDILDSVFSSNDYTIEALYYSSDSDFNGAGGMVFNKWDTTGSNNNCFIIYFNNFSTDGDDSSEYGLTGAAIDGDTLYAAGLMDSDVGYYRQNNVSYGSDSNMHSYVSTLTMRSGRFSKDGFPTYDFYGTVYELRVSDTPRSKAWTDATYYTLYDNLMTVASGGSPPPTTIEPDWQDNWTNFYTLTVDSDKIGENLGNFPVMVTLSSGSGIDNFDNSGIFDTLETGAGLDSYTKFMQPTEGDLSESEHWISYHNNTLMTINSGISCIYFDETYSFLSVEDSDDWDFGTGDFTVECWANMTYNALLTNEVNRIYGHGSVTAVNGSWTFACGGWVGWGGGTRLEFNARDNGVNNNIVSDDASSIFTPNDWHHLAASRESGTLRFYVDGNFISSHSCPEDLFLSAAYFLRIGNSDHNLMGEMPEGYMTRFRISKDISRYNTVSGIFTPPEEYINDEYTKFLYYTQGDQSDPPHNITMKADPMVSISSPLFDDTAYWGFDGDDYKLLADHADWDFGSDDFTIEFWARNNTLSNWQDHITKRATSAVARWIAIATDVSGELLVAISSSGGAVWDYQSSAPVSIKTGQWYHVVLSRENNTIYTFFNGLLVDTGTFTGAVYSDATPVVIGAGAVNGDYAFDGDIFGLKISKGLCRYNENFTPYNPPNGDSYPNRKKIQLADEDHNRLYAEIEKWDHANRQAWLHVQTSALVSGHDSTLYLYYDEAQSDNTLYVGDITDTPSKKVWDGDFSAVWHMTFSDYYTSQPFVDSTINTNTGANTATLTPTDITEGLTTPGIYFDGTATYVNVADDPTLDLTTDYTLEIFFRPTASEGVDEIICKASNDSNGYQFRGDSGTGPNFMTGAGTAVGRSNWESYGWQYAAGVQTTASAILYVDGSKYSESASIGSPTNSTPFYIGTRWDSYYYNGDIAEIRVSTTDRSEAWTTATYYSLFDDLITYEQGVKPVYTASGTTSVNGSLVNGIPVRLYRRSTGELTDSTVSSNDGQFTLDSIYDEEHYTVALYTTSGTNAIVYDWLTP